MAKEEKIGEFKPFNKKTGRKVHLEKIPFQNLKEEDVLKITHELRIHQIELEMQNEELRNSQQALEELLHKYNDLFDFAPVGYFVIDTEGIILESNLTGSLLVGIERSLLVKKPFWLCIRTEDRDVFYLAKREVLDKRASKRCDLKMLRKTKGEFFAELLIDPIINGQGDAVQCRMAVIDISARKEAQDLLQLSRKELVNELDTAQMLQEISTQLIQSGDTKALQEQILDAVMKILHADCASLQLFKPHRGDKGELLLLGYRGFNEQAVKFWKWVSPSSKSSCGMALCTGERVIVPDVRKCELMKGSEDLAILLQNNILAIQTTPLRSHSGTLTGMLSTHWREPHEMKDGEIRVLDILARLGGDLLEIKQAQLQLESYNNMLFGINRIFETVVTSKNEEEFGTACLTVAEELTGSAFSFLGEIGAEGLLHDIAISNPGWKACSMYDTKGHRKPQANFHIHGIYGRAVTDGIAVLTNDPASHPDSIGLPKDHPPLKSFLTVPLKDGPKVIGLIDVGNREGGYGPDQHVALEALAPAVAVALIRRRAEEALRKTNDELELQVEKRTRSLSQTIRILQNEIRERERAEDEIRENQQTLKNLSAELQLAEERARHKIAEDLHDSICQILAFSARELKTLRKSVQGKTAESIDEIVGHLDNAAQQTRTLCFDLSPSALYHLGFEIAIEELVERVAEQAKIKFKFEDCGNSKPLSDDVKILLYRSIRELLINATKHANADSINVSLVREGNNICVKVEDDGDGFDESILRDRLFKAKGFGLFSIRERLDHIGGQIKIDSAAGKGTRVVLIAPLNFNESAESEID
jgi:PAS domain S-box-containing protein